VPEELSVARVAARVEDGGHDVPEDKVRARWHRLWAHVVEMIELASSAEVLDNSGAGPATVATFVEGEAVGRPRWPAWAPDDLTRRWPGRAQSD
jgi:predicted ABC-type ATPase